MSTNIIVIIVDSVIFTCYCVRIMKQKKIKIHIDNIKEALKNSSVTPYAAGLAMDKNYNFCESASFVYRLLSGKIENVTFQKMIALSETLNLNLHDMFYLINYDSTISNSSTNKSKKITVDGD